MPLLFLLTACLAATDNGSAVPGVTHAAPETLAFDAMFIDGMIYHHENAVDMAEIARERGVHAEIVAMAESVVVSQQAEIDTMKAWRTAWFADGPARALPGTSSRARMLHDVEALKEATPFDAAFLDAMIPHHESAVEMANYAARRAEHAEIRDLAERIARDQTTEIEQMEAWQRAWYPTAVASIGPR